MDLIALQFLLLILLIVFVGGLRTHNGYLQLPFLVTLVMLGWFVPQAIRLLHNPFLPNNGYILTMFYVSACIVAIMVGWRKRLRITASYQAPNYDHNKLLIYSAVLSVIGLIAYGLSFRIERQFTSEGLSTGIFTVLFFFSQLKYFGLAIALAILLRKFSWVALFIVLIDFNSISAFILFGGRRGPVIFMLMVVATLLYFRKGIKIPKAAVLAGFVVVTVFVNGAGTYRAFVEVNARPPSMGEMLEAGITDGTLNNLKNYEVTNAITYVKASYDSAQYDFGVQYWNFFVFSYIPGQFIGAQTKQALMFPLQDIAVLEYGYRRHIGTTFTGFADSFMAFSFFGVFVFYLMSRLMGRLWSFALRDDFGSQIFYACALSAALHGITHSTQWFFVFYFQVIIFLLPGLYWAKRKRRQRGRQSLNLSTQMNYD